jgi:hypothetical protein
MPKYSLQDLINAYNCGYGDRDARLAPFNGERPKTYLSTMLAEVKQPKSSTSYDDYEETLMTEGFDL